jgi:hypothetical protein
MTSTPCWSISIKPGYHAVLNQFRCLVDILVEIHMNWITYHLPLWKTAPDAIRESIFSLRVPAPCPWEVLTACPTCRRMPTLYSWLGIGSWF